MNFPLKAALGSAVSMLALMVTSQLSAQQPTPAAPEPPIDVTVTAPGGVPVEQTPAGPVRGYQALTTQTGPRLPTPLLDLPQSVNVVPRKVIDDQGAITQSDVLRNVSGVQPLSPLSFGQIGPKVRGFAAERYVDGLPNYYDGGARDLLVNVERIEVLKGPSSIFYQGGPNPTGGVVNVVSRAPTTTNFATFGTTFGTYPSASPFFDVNQAVNADKSIILRFTGQYEFTRDSVEVLQRQSYALNPSLLLTNKDATSLLLQGHLSRRAQQDYSGLPAVGSIDRSAYSVKSDLFPGWPRIEKAYSTNQNVTARFDHAFSDTWSTFTSARIGRSRFDEPSQFTLSNMPDFAPSTFGMFNGLLKEKTSEISVNTNLVAKFDLGSVRNRLLFSFDYNRVTDRGSLYGDFAGLVDFADPEFPAYLRPTPNPFNTFIDADNRYTQMGAVAQIQSTIFERLHVLAALRLGYVEIDSKSLNTGTSYNTQDTKLLPRIGAAYEVTRGLSVFGAYSEGMRAVPFFTGINPPKPEEAWQIEGGIKFDMAYGISGSMALFQITRRNVPVGDPLNPGLSIQTGEQRSRGFEADVIWQPNVNVSFLANYAFTYATVTKDPVIEEGSWLQGVPRHSGRVWANYLFTEGPLANVSVGLGLTGVSQQAVTLASAATSGQWKTPGYVTLDSKVAYRWDNFNFMVTAKNLTNEKGYMPYPFFEGRVAPLPGRVVYGAMSTTF